MGDMTRAELRAELIIRMDNRVDSIMTETRYNTALLFGYRWVCQPSVYRHPELQGSFTLTLSTSKTQYGNSDGVPTDLWAMHSLANTTKGRRLHPRGIRQLDEELIRTGEPSVYAMFGHDGTTRYIEIRDQPSSAYSGDTIVGRYWKRPTAWSADTAKTVIAPEFDQIILEFAAWRLWTTLEQPDRADVARQVGAAMVNDVTDPFDIEGEDTGAAVEVIVSDPMPSSSL